MQRKERYAEPGRLTSPSTATYCVVLVITEDPIGLDEAAARIRSGELVAFPTETVYGLGANALDAAAVEKIYELKGRPATSPLIVHVASIEMARNAVAHWPPLAERLAERWWPGPMTLVLPKRPTIPDIVTAGLPTVGVRIPRHPIALDLIRRAGVPIAAPSANKFMGVSPTEARHVRAAFGDAVPVLDGGSCEVGLESTVIAFEGDRARVLRPGMLPKDALAEIDAAADESPLDLETPDGAHASPGMHRRHYSPRTRVVLLESGDPLPPGDGVYVWYHEARSGARSVQMPADASSYAARLYSTLHALDDESPAWIAIEIPPDGAEWRAVHDRLRRAASK